MNCYFFMKGQSGGQGMRGDKGPQGPNGEKGDRGPIGKDGPKGPKVIDLCPTPIFFNFTLSIIN